MIVPGRICNGVVVLEGDTRLPEGAAVTVVYPAQPAAASTIHVSPIRKAVELPLVKTREPGSLDLTNDQIYEILYAEEEEAAKAQMG